MHAAHDHDHFGGLGIISTEELARLRLASLLGTIDANEGGEIIDALAAEVIRLRAQVAAAERLVEAAHRLRKLHEQSLRTADFHNVSCQCPRCIDDAIVAALAAWEAAQ